MFNFIPLPYRILGAVVAFAAVGAFGYMKGIEHGNLKQETAIAQKNVELIKLNAQLDANKDKIVTEYVDKWKVVKEKEFVYVDTAKNDVPSQSDMSNGWVYLHDTSATNSDADSTRASDESSSGIKDNQALAVIVSNYARCTQNANQLIALQKWVIDSKAIIEESNKKAKK
jgi:hypothetical protein